MNELNFIVWDNDAKLWVNPESVLEFTSSGLKSKDDKNISIFNDSYMVDQNGRKLYEDTIVKTTLTDTEGNMYRDVIGKVYFSEHEYCLEMNSGFWPLASWHLVNSFEVIGHMKESPDIFNDSTPPYCK